MHLQVFKFVRSNMKSYFTSLPRIFMQESWLKHVKRICIVSLITYCGYRLYKDVYWRVVRNKEHAPKGIKNIGNTCFMNAILQNLAWCPNLKAELEQVEFKKFCKMTMGVLQLLRYTHSKLPVQFMPLKILEAARKSNSIFERNDQQDSFEMFNTIIATMKAELQKLHEENKSAGLNGHQIFQSRQALQITADETGEEKIVFKLPGVECIFQEFSSLSVPILFNGEESKENNKDTIQEYANRKAFETMGNNYTNETDIERGMMHGLMKTEEFEEQIMPCRKCDLPGLDGICYRKMLIFKPPSIMVLHIDRFNKDNNGGMTKRDDLVTYPETLNIESFGSIAIKETEADQHHSFNLFGVVVHSGKLDGGHYVAYIKNKQLSSSNCYEQSSDQFAFDDNQIYENTVVGKLEEDIVNDLHFQNNSNENNDKRYTLTMPEVTSQDDSKWYYINDDTVKTATKEEAINNKNAYMLMYVKA